MSQVVRPHVVVLAGGEEGRLAPLTRALYGIDLPKQFAVLDGERSLLQQTVERALELTTSDKVWVVVSVRHAQLARAQVAQYPGIKVVVQPRELPTAAGMLLPIARILSRTWDAQIAFLPADHYVASWAPIARAIRAACDGALQDRIVLVGAEPSGTVGEPQWLLRGARIGRTGGFEARPCEAQVVAKEELLRRDALWSTGIHCGPVDAYWELLCHCLPAQARAVERYAIAIGGLDEELALEDACRELRLAGPGLDLLAQAEGLAVIPVTGTGWSAWSAPQHVFASLAGTQGLARLVERIRGGGFALAG